MNTDLYTIFTRTHIVFLLWFLAVYVLLSFVVSLFGNQNAEQNQQLSSRFFDVIMFVIVFLVMANIVLYNNVNLSMFNEVNFQKLDDPVTLVASIIHIFVFYAIIFAFGISMKTGVKSFAIALYEGVAWLFVLIVSMSVFFKYVLHVPLTEGLFNMWNKFIAFVTNKSAVDTNEAEKKITPKNEVFNIRNNTYNFEEAEKACSSYGARLATYDDIEKSYNEGGEWCNYGWSDGQMIYFPTQKETWDKLQKNPKTKNNCGRPGINGGFIDNPHLKFGVNCFGERPKPTENDIAFMNAQKEKIIPTSPEEAKLDDKANIWKNNHVKINSFNHEKWSAY